MSAFRLLLLLSLAIFVGETAIMFVLDYLPIDNEVLRNIADATALIIIVFPLLYFFVFKTILTAQERLEDRIRERTNDIAEANRALEQSVKQLGVRQQQMVLLGEMGNFFQACRGISEAMTVAETQLRRLFPDLSGTLFLMNSSRNILEKTVAWGHPVVMDSGHAPEDCWALRRSKPHIVREIDRTITCRHMLSVEAPWHICLPLTAQGETLGILCLLAQSTPTETVKCCDDVGGERMEFYIAVAENLALAVANLRLRETLRYQALRDPLTGLFNRRYLLDTLDRELQRAAGRDQNLSVVMLDIDHFKRFNDSFGHAAGDTVLRKLGDLLRKQSRGEDIVCRYGGEEFTIVLPDTSSALALEKIDALRRAIETLAVEHYGQSLAQVTISAGIATYPVHGMDSNALLHLADQALYSAKQGGRNRVSIAPDTAGLAHILDAGIQPDLSAARGRIA